MISDLQLNFMEASIYNLKGMIKKKVLDIFKLALTSHYSSSRLSLSEIFGKQVIIPIKHILNYIIVQYVSNIFYISYKGLTGANKFAAFLKSKYWTQMHPSFLVFCWLPWSAP